MSHKILVGSTDFMNQLAEDAARATDRLYVQAMTFEGDAAGEALIALLLSSPALDRRLCIDSYSKVVVNDQFVFSPGALFSKTFRAEVNRGKSLLDNARNAGVKVSYTNPVGAFMHRYPFRNHKKSVVCDNVVYLGGVNFSDHNFSWHDMMVRLDDESTATAISTDFQSNFEGIRTMGTVSTPIGKLFFLPGILNGSTVGKSPARDVAEVGMKGVFRNMNFTDRSRAGTSSEVGGSSSNSSGNNLGISLENGVRTRGKTGRSDGWRDGLEAKPGVASVYKELFDAFRNARQEILILSPYVSSPLLDLLKYDVAQSVKVDIVTPEVNNKSLFKKNLLYESAQGYFNLYFYPGEMSHLKAVLIDRKTLIVGSSNYDFASYYFEDEIMMSISDSTLIKLFVDQVVDSTMQSARAVEGKFHYRSSAILLKSINIALAKIADIKGISLGKTIS